jgi:hypothetical protein
MNASAVGVGRLAFIAEYALIVVFLARYIIQNVLIAEIVEKTNFFKYITQYKWYL